MSRFQFVADNSATYPVKRLCELVEVERSSYYAWKSAAPGRAERAAADAALADRIRVVHDADNTVGAPRITAELNEGEPAHRRVNHKRVARVMRAAGIVGYVKKRRVRTTIPEPADQKVPDLLERDDWRAHKEGKQAEFLLEHRFPWHLIERIGVHSAAVYGQVVNALPAHGHRPTVEVRADWYY